MSIIYRKDQKDIIKYTSGTMGIQAVPGAGKTFIITHLAAKLLNYMKEKNIEGKILVLTYMNSAANNFKSRIKTMVDKSEKSRFEVMTIHSLCMKIIRENTNLAFIDGEFEVVDDYKKSMLISEAIKKFKEDGNESRIYSFLDKKQNNETNRKKWEREFESIVLNSIKLLKYADISEDELEKIVDKKYRGIMEIISPIYSIYQESLRREGYMDYDDILLIANKILSENKDVKKFYQEKYYYVLEDECQDSNFIQGQIVEMISSDKKIRRKSKKNLVRVGDVNQSITGTFAGSDPRFFMDFLKEADLSYEMNMASRSSKDIIEVANELVKSVNTVDGVLKNEKLVYKKILNPIFIEEIEKNKGYKENPITKNYMISAKTKDDEAAELRAIENYIRFLRENYPDYSIGVLAFSNFDANVIFEYLLSKGIECEKLGDSSIRKKLLSDIKLFIDFLLSPDDEEIFLNIIKDVFFERNLSVELSDEDKEAIFQKVVKIDSEKFIYDLEYFKKEVGSICVGFEDIVKRSLSNLFSDVRKFFEGFLEKSLIDYISLVKYIGTNLNTSKNEEILLIYILFYIERIQNFKDVDLRRVSTFFDRRYSRIFDSIIEGIYEGGEYEAEGGSITVSTLHKSKGMEWDAVIISGIDENNFPTDLNSYFRIDRKYLKFAFRYPEAFVNMEIDKINFDKKKASQRKYEPTDKYNTQVDCKFDEIKNNGIDKKGDIDTFDIKKYEDDLKIDIISERTRLFYVGITRAKRSLILINSRKKYIESINKSITRKESRYFTYLDDFIRQRKMLK